MKAKDRRAVQGIDRKIAEITQDLQRLESAVCLRNTELRTLRGARGVLTGGGSTPPPPNFPVWDVVAARQRLFPDSVFTRATRLLEEVGQPLHVSELTAQLRARGYDINSATLVGVLARAVKRSWIRRVAPNVYALASNSAVPPKTGTHARRRSSRPRTSRPPRRRGKP